MLSDELKKTIQAAYSNWLTSHGFSARYGQRLMIADIANILAQDVSDNHDSERICVVEAGTGIGKTVAYILAAIPIARALNKKLVIATATVALQEQLVLKDLPDLIQHSGLEFSFSLAKGRGRYLCLSKLDGVLKGGQQQTEFFAPYPDEGPGQNHPPALQLYENMLQTFLRGDWNGDRDDWSEPVDDRDWRVLTSDRSQCHNRRCSFVGECCFFQARDKMDDVDCVVTNHDLVLADLVLGGGAILPAPQDSIYIFDEAHHLSHKAVQHFSSSLRVNSTQKWLQQQANALEHMREQWPNAKNAARQLEDVVAISNELQPLLRELPELLDSYFSAQNDQPRDRRPLTHRFAAHSLPPELSMVSTQLQGQFKNLATQLAVLTEVVEKDMENATDEVGRRQLEEWYPALGAGVNRADAHERLFHYYAAAEQETIPRAWWLTKSQFDATTDFGLHSAPLLAASYLQEMLWSPCYAAVLTSATLTALGKFDQLVMRSGIAARSHFRAIPSPFDFASNAIFEVPELACNPSDQDTHSTAIADYLHNEKFSGGVLVLFSSRKQMRTVYELLRAELCDSVLMQDDYSKQALLSEHRRRIDANEPSVIFGLASFAEGIDLRGAYCTHVVIAKIPFAVPDDPVEEALAEWIEAQGRNAFIEISVPDAALKLVQACGRLLRAETDRGTVTLLDSRIVQKRYGRDLLASLPPFKQHIHQSIGHSS
ncbi:MAG: ATP-dependent DNA helicase DinG [Pseudomonadales bacterium]